MHPIRLLLLLLLALPAIGIINLHLQRRGHPLLSLRRLRCFRWRDGGGGPVHEVRYACSVARFFAHNQAVRWGSRRDRPGGVKSWEVVVVFLLQPHHLHLVQIIHSVLIKLLIASVHQGAFPVAHPLPNLPRLLLKRPLLFRTPHLETEAGCIAHMVFGHAVALLTTLTGALATVFTTALGAFGTVAVAVGFALPAHPALPMPDRALALLD